MKKLILVGLAVVCMSSIVGCIQQETSCAANAELNINETSEKPSGVGGTANGVGDNQSCLDNSECVSDECVPTIVHVPNTIGMCWSDAFNGCTLVDFEQWVVDDFCGGLELVVCQPTTTPEMEINCVPTNGSTAPWKANFLCCDPSFL